MLPMIDKIAEVMATSGSIPCMKFAYPRTIASNLLKSMFCCQACFIQNAPANGKYTIKI